MKDKNRLIKFLGTGLLVTLLGIVLGFLLNKIFEKGLDNISVEVAVYLALFFCVAAVILTTIILYRTETVEEYRYEVTKILGDGFIRIYQDSISEFATTLVTRSKYVRVVGTARQDMVASTSLRSAKDYLLALESKLKNDCSDMANAFTYLRVVPRTPTAALNQHIANCNSAVVGKCHKFEVKTNLQFPFYVSFQIFDDTDLLVILDNKLPNNKHDNALCLWTRNKEIIEKFIKRFDNAWEETN
ncbi:hypothetical protein AGMMS49982_10310 [Bacteroidia bacterium]|nr:hypothetical protein AGMMS49982_10310 [Bacteroidia bacterium]